MLDKIHDINLNLNSSRLDYYSPHYGKNRKENRRDLNSTDTLKCSEAIQYLKQKDWQIKELLFLSNKQISISVEVSGLIFHTSIDTNELNSISTIEYIITSEKRDELNRKLSAYFIMDINPVGFEDKNDNQFHGLHLLFNKLFSLNLSEGINIDESSILNNIFEDETEMINNELSYVNFCIFEFIRKLTGSKVNIVLNEISPAISLVKIKVEE